MYHYTYNVLINCFFNFKTHKQFITNIIIYYVINQRYFQSKTKSEFMQREPQTKENQKLRIKEFIRYDVYLSKIDFHSVNSGSFLLKAGNDQYQFQCNFYLFATFYGSDRSLLVSLCMSACSVGLLEYYTIFKNLRKYQLEIYKLYEFIFS